MNRRLFHLVGHYRYYSDIAPYYNIAEKLFNLFFRSCWFQNNVWSKYTLLTVPINRSTKGWDVGTSGTVFISSISIMRRLDCQRWKVNSGSLSLDKYFGSWAPSIISLNIQHIEMPLRSPGCTEKPIIRCVKWSITTITQWDFNRIDSTLKKSIDHKLFFICPMNVSHDGPLPLIPGL